LPNEGARFSSWQRLQAEKTSREIFGTEHCIEVQDALLRLWQSAKTPGRAALFCDSKQTYSSMSHPSEDETEEMQ
jgi:hypothetical protein